MILQYLIGFIVGVFVSIVLMRFSIKVNQKAEIFNMRICEIEDDLCNLHNEVIMLKMKKRPKKLPKRRLK